MNRQQYLLLCAMEECDELSQRLSKAIRFGLDEIQPGQNENNARRICLELADLMGAFDLITADAVMKPVLEAAFPGDAVADQWIKAKKRRIERYYQYSVQQGTVTP
jgi:hypothetical protein